MTMGQAGCEKEDPVIRCLVVLGASGDLAGRYLLHVYLALPPTLFSDTLRALRRAPPGLSPAADPSTPPPMRGNGHDREQHRQSRARDAFQYPMRSKMSEIRYTNNAGATSSAIDVAPPSFSSE